jgi:hypothetical protein
MRKTTPQLMAKSPFPLPDVVTKVIPAPTEGWDAISPLASMDPKRAPILNNWVCRPGWIELRQGFTPWSWVGSDVAVESLLVYESPTQEKLFAAAGSVIYETSQLGQYDPVLSSLSSARWEYVNFTPAAAATVIQLVNGLDQLRQYDGSSWSTPSISGLPAGLNTSAIVNIYAQKRRLWYILGDGSGGRSTIAAFMPTDAISGAIGGTIDFGALWTEGGFLVAMSDWTIDGGSGPQDYAAFISSNGQLTIYAGTDPTSATNWSLVGTFNLSPPISNRCMTKVGSDVAVITQQGIVPLSQALPYDPSADRSVSITARIQNTMAQYTIQARDNFGWQVLSYPGQQLAIVNVPLTENLQQVQLIMNALTGAWSQFLGWNANVFAVFQDSLYFGGNDGTINLAYSGGLDLTSPIIADMQCAFNWFDDPGRIKRISMVQPLMIANGTVTPAMSVDEDFVISTATAPITILGGTIVWDTARWDVDVWPATNAVVKPWLSVEAIGHALAIHLTVNVATNAGAASSVGAFDAGIFDTALFDQDLSTLAPQLQVNAFNAIMELGGFI